MNLDYFFSGLDVCAYKYMGVHKLGDGVEFYLYAPDCKEVEVCLLDKNSTYPLERIDERGMWHLVIDNCDFDYNYRYTITTNNNQIIETCDPYSYCSNDSSHMTQLDYSFEDKEYMLNRKVDYHSAVNIYELHLNSFKHENGKTTYKQLIKDLIPYVKEMGYTHIEIIKLLENSIYDIENQYGTKEEFAQFIDEAHLQGIGVIIDFNITDNFYVRYVKEKHNINYLSGPVISYLMSSVNMLISEYHIDGIKVNGIEDVLNNSDDRSITFLKRFNYTLKSNHPDVLLITENSSEYERITKKVENEGLGFDYLWNKVWVNDTLQYYQCPLELRQYCHNLLTFSMSNFYREKCILPLSHYDVLPGKGTILDKMCGEYDDKFKQCRNMFVYMFTHPGKKLNFAGNEIGMFREFDENRELDWNLLNYPIHDSFNRFFKDMIGIYTSYKAFYAYDYDEFSFKWIDERNYKESIYIYARYDEENCFVVVLNMLNKAYNNYLIGVPMQGEYTEIMNTDRDIYSGSNMCNCKLIKSEKTKAHGMPNSIAIDIAPYAAIIFSIKLKKKAPTVEDPNTLATFECTQ